MVGIDIVQIARIEKKSKDAVFLNGVFTQSELLYYTANGSKPDTLAGFFAAKEAVAKALGIGFNGFRPNDIEIMHNELGAPHAVLKNKAKELLANKTVHISISHDGGIAAAIAVLK